MTDNLNNTAILSHNTTTISPRNAKSIKRGNSQFVAVVPCPVCDRTHDNDCRQSKDDPDFILCHTFADATVGSTENGYRCVKESNGHTASFKRISGGTAQKFTTADRSTKRQTESELDVDTRNLEYGRVFGRLSLLPHHREALNLRGLTDSKIDTIGYKSIKPGQRVGDFSPNLPGVRNGAITCLHPGIAYPIRDTLGRITAIWYKPDIAGNGKYKPLSDTDNPVHLNGEIPLGYFPAKEIQDTGFSQLWLMEGHGLKPAIANHKHGIEILAASGGNFTASLNTLKVSLEAICKAGDTIVLCPDAGDVQNRQCTNRWVKTARLLEELGYSTEVAWWEQTTKDEADIDELDELPLDLNFISIESFANIAKEEIHQFVKDKMTEVKVDNSDRYQTAWKNSGKFEPTKTVHMKDFESGKIPLDNAIIAVKSGLGTNKTGWAIDVLKASERGALFIGYRNNLLHQTIARAAEKKIWIYHIQDEQGQQMIIDDYACHALCLDSIHHVDGYFHHKDIYLDEACSVLLHALGGGTLGSHQAKAIAILSKALRICNRVFLLDGNLSDLQVSLISKLAPDKKVIKIENTQKIAPHDITFVDGVNIEEEVKKRDKSALVKTILEQDCLPWIACDSRSQAEVLHEVLNNSGKKGYVLHSETVCEEWAKQFLADPNEFILKNKPEYFIISPTAESGVSITVNDYFTHKFSFFVGVLGTNSQHQMMFRLRDNKIPHYVFCPEKSAVKDTSDPYTYEVEVYRRIQNERILQSASLAGERVTEALNDALTRQQDDWRDLSCKLGAFHNYEMDNLRACLIHALKEAGHNVKTEQWLQDQEINEDLKQARIIINKKKADELFVAQEYPSIKEAEEAAKSNPNKEKQRQIEKTYLLDKLSEIKENPIYSAEFIYECHVRRRRFIEQQQRYWLLKNFEISQQKHIADWFYASTSEFFFSGRATKMRHDKIWALNELNILKLEGTEYHKDSPEIVEVVRTLRDRRDIQLALNIQLEKETIDGKERIRILNNLLESIGLENKFTQQKLVNGVKLRHYCCQAATSKDYDLVAAREAILKCTEIKMLAWNEKNKEIDIWEEYESKPVLAEWTEVQKTSPEWLTNQNVRETASMLETVETQEDFNDYKEFLPSFVIKAAASCLQKAKLNQLTQFGVEKISFGLFANWLQDNELNRENKEFNRFCGVG